MAQDSEIIKEILKSIDAETTALGTRVDEVLSKLKPGMTPEEIAELQQEGQRIVSRLRVIASDPAEPLPPEAPATA